ncbi:hypothetical protein [uncultured Desulfosarcina sp.]|uniref:hypothetical protein n=1 Tax=uncultured Desulfosarcina sp. TaxID=218289 RepID=UPI0029C7F31A|nr:hypothetical protein [uncultured Desulfosarcina sp.]
MTNRNCASGKIMSTTNEIDQIVQEILEDKSLKEKADIANLEEKDILHFQDLFDTYISGQLCQDNEIGKDVMNRVWEVLQETHRIRSEK